MKKLLKKQANRPQTTALQIRAQRNASIFLKNAIYDYRAWQRRIVIRTEDEKIADNFEKTAGIYNYRMFKRVGRAYGKTPVPKKICLIVGRARGVNQRFALARTTSRQLAQHGFLSGQQKSS